MVLSNIAARTSKIGLFTGVTTLSLLDPVRAFEDYSTLDNLSGGRLELIIGKGNGAAQAELFHVTTADQWDRNREGYELFRLLWESEDVTWSGRFRPALVNAKALPRPLQKRLRIWHGSATSKDSVDLAARFGDPIFSANVTYPVEPYAELVRHYRAAVGVLRPSTRGCARRRRHRRVPRRGDLAAGGGRVPARLRDAPGVPAPRRTAGGVRVDGGLRGPQLGIDRQPAAGDRQGAVATTSSSVTR